MSAPTTRDPLKVTTREGAMWTRRGVNAEGRGLYALEGVEDCPTQLLVTLPELAEHGVRSADPLAAAVAELGALPVPVGDPIPYALTDKVPAPLPVVESGISDFCTARCESLRADAAAAELARLRARVAELEAASPTERYVSRVLPARDALCTCGHAGIDHHHGDTKCWAHLPKVREANGTWSATRICECAEFTASEDVSPQVQKLPLVRQWEDVYESPLARGPHPVPHDLPETGARS
ncbi:hypothetical protein HHX38_08590 [Streptomyces sp. PKU-MA01144]|uniref:hypothetical protein n=1 Tax=Streptomyces sp. PKU-MA01144 TaxID=2729138 RepID=UPI00147DC63A|nr:hypothetical protein [Streptomyces sp. PKU-MA01144]NNJ04191.1 hypothetical protein [Streptomyces sp. PKU-MA01144]